MATGGFVKVWGMGGGGGGGSAKTSVSKKSHATH